MKRREFLAGLGLGFAASAWAEDHFPFGPLGTPRAIPAWPVVTHTGAAAEVASMVRGHVTALQLMFTSCSATCPIQGAIFAKAQQQLGGAVAGGQFVSLSIDPETDTPAEMAGWLKKFKARPGWVGLTPRAAQIDEIFKLLGDGGMPRPQGPDPHTSQVYVIDRKGRLVFRTPSMPPARQIVEAMVRVAGLAG